jgi:hypothetical protein
MKQKSFRIEAIKRNQQLEIPEIRSWKSVETFCLYWRDRDILPGYSFQSTPDRD